MARNLLIYVMTLVPFLAIDALWLGWIARSTYVAEIGNILKPAPDWLAAGIFYLLYAAGLVLFAVLPGLRAGSLLQTFLLGGALGLVAYGTYDLTNLTVMNGFGWRIALIDLAWGTFLSAITATIAVALAQRFAV